MTVLDDVVLGSLLDEAAEGFAIPTEGADDILQRARRAAWTRRRAGRATAEVGGGGPGRGPGRHGPDDDVPARRRRSGDGRYPPNALSLRRWCSWWPPSAGHDRSAHGATPTATTAAPLLQPHAPGGRRRHPPGSTSIGVHGTVAAPAAGPARRGAVHRTAAGPPDRQLAAALPPRRPPRRCPLGRWVSRPGSNRPAPWIWRSGEGELARTIAKLSVLAAAYGGFVANSQCQSGSGGGAPFGRSPSRCRWTTSPRC